MTESTPPKDGEPTSLLKKTKKWYGKHEPKIRIVVRVTLFAAGTALAVYLAQKRDEEGPNAEELGDHEPLPDSEAAGEPRRSFPDPDRDPFLRKLPPGQQASEEARARYRELTGDELPDGYTVVRRWLYEKAA